MGQSLKYDKEYLEELLVVTDTVRAERQIRKNMNDWELVLVIMQEKYPDRKLTKESVRNSYRRLTNANRVNNVVKERDDRRMGRTSNHMRVLAETKYKRPIYYIMERLELTEPEVMAAVAKLQLEGYRGVSVFKENGVTYVHNRIRYNTSQPLLSGDEEGIHIYDGRQSKTIEFAVVSDTHFGNINADKKSLHEFYNLINKRGIKTVLHVGDLVDGYYTNRPTSVLEQYATGYTDQLKDFVKDFPKIEGITTYGITGNHDYTHMRNGFANMGEGISAIRPDFVYLGHNFGRIYLGPKVSVSLIHPTDGISQNFNKKIRDMIERSPERRSDIMLIGHYHKIAMVQHRGINAYVVPSFEKKTSFMQDMGLDSIVGGMIFKVKTDKDDNILSVVTEIIEYNDDGRE